MAIVEMTKSHAPAVARLHRRSIRTGLTAWLGQRFCKQVYLGMADSPHSFVLVCEDDRHRALGFVCCAADTTRMYRNVMTRRFLPLILAAIWKVLARPSVIRDMITAIRRPRRFSQDTFAEVDLPQAEIVSIGVDPEAQGRGIGARLLEAAFARFRDLGFDRARVWTTEDNVQAIAFYQKRGFKLVGARQHHTGGIRVFVADICSRRGS